MFDRISILRRLTWLHGGFVSKARLRSLLNWTGIRLADLLANAGVKPTARYLWFDGADRGVGRAPDFVRSLPIEKALDRDTLLAYEMNGEPLPVPHGFPLRAVVPGWEGAYSVKWLTHIQVSGEDYDGPFVQSGYRYPRRPVVPGATVPAHHHDGQKTPDHLTPHSPLPCLHQHPPRTRRRGDS